MTTKKIGLVSLGCPKNLVDSEGMVGRLKAAGYTFAARDEEADLVLINTCGFIDTAKEESVDTILTYCDLKSRGKLEGLVVTGCLVQRYGEELTRDISEVDRFLSIRDEEQIVTVVDSILGSPGMKPVGTDPPRAILTPFHTAYLKVSEGCSNRCSYCTIPLIRGPHESRDVEALLDEARKLADRGVRELIVIGQDITRFGVDRTGSDNLAGLVKKLADVDSLHWIRLMYLHPDHLDDELIELMAAEPKVLSYLDLPAQHICDSVLRKMNRPGGSQRIRDRIAALREKLPGLVLRTSLIVGFPGEGDREFQELCDFVEETGFDHLGVFSYSREAGTPAARYPDQVSQEVKAERQARVMELQRGISRRKNGARVGQTLEVLVEGASPETDLLLAGRYYGQAPEVDGSVLINEGNGMVGAFQMVHITEAHDYDLVGTLVEK
ncbi:MAG: 30S ribosomal protein S12 methylthiotransferase RimO [bacterium]|nr:30S ribosomal protein S12 methylthiotransferase RimO [bacterium]